MTPASPDTPVPLSPHSPEVQLAAFIVGCLTFEEHILLNPADQTSLQNYAGAVRLVASILAQMHPQHGDLPVLPFSW